MKDLTTVFLYQNDSEIDSENAVSDQITKEIIEQKIKERDPEILFAIAIQKYRESKTEEEKYDAIKIIAYVADNGYEPAIEIMKKLMENSD